MDLEMHVGQADTPKPRVTLGGRLDTHTFGALDAELAPLLANPRVTALVLDLAALEYISSAGLRSIFKARKALAARGGKVLVLTPQPLIQKVFDVVKAVPLSEIFSSVAEADAYLDAMQRRVVEGGERDED